MPHPHPHPHPPSPDAVRQLLQRADVEPVDEGGEHSTWWVGTDLVLRLALDEDGTARQRREIALRDLIRPRLPVAVPKSIATGEWSPGLTYTLDSRLPGRSAELRAISLAGERDLSTLLAGLR